MFLATMTGPEVSQRLGNDIRKAKLLHLLQLTVRGVPTIYYGEEIGMTNLKLPFATALDPIPHKFKFVPRFVFDLLGKTFNRDEVRTPMQWSNEKNAGFSSAETTWLPVHPNHDAVNVERESKDESSLLNAIRAILKVRNQELALRDGNLEWIHNLPDEVLGYKRKNGTDTLAIFLNFNDKEKEFQFGEDNWMSVFGLSKEDHFNAGILKLTGVQWNDFEEYKELKRVGCR